MDNETLDHPCSCSMKMIGMSHSVSEMIRMNHSIGEIIVSFFLKIVIRKNLCFDCRLIVMEEGQTQLHKKDKSQDMSIQSQTKSV